MIQQLVITHDNAVLESHTLSGRVRECLANREEPPPPEERLPELPTAPRPLKDVIAEIERDLLLKALRQCGSYSNVAKLFQINRSTLFRKLQRLQTGENDGEDQAL